MCDRPAIPNPRPIFNPKRDTVFFRPMAHSLQNNLRQLSVDFRGIMGTLEHVAIPLDLKMSVSRRDWLHGLNAFASLKSLTLILGCAEKSWTGDPSIELRHLEEWFADGRQRTVVVDHGAAYLPRRSDQDIIASRRLRDVAELPRLIVEFAGPQKSIAVRVVAWKRTT